MISARVDKWKNKLIDLTKRNRLINFKPTKVTTIRIIDEQPPEVFETLVTKLKTMDFISLPEKNEIINSGGETEEKILIDARTKEFTNYDKTGLAEKHLDSHLQTDLTSEQLSKNLFRIHSSATSVMEEQGYNVLFLAVGFLEWYEAANSDIKMKSPLVLIPIELSRPSVKGIYKVKYNEDSVLLNPALRQKLNLDFGINLQDIDDDLEKIDLLKVFSDIQNNIEHKERWRVTNDIFLGLFSFAKFMMYKDLEANSKDILENEVIKIICGQQSKERQSLGALCSWEELKESIKPQNTFQVLDADSSQQRAIIIVKKGNNLVIEGPPGTGKSQTIANIIGEMLADGKKVLFVSQKMAALEVVKKRLEAVGLGDFCLELHSRLTNKKRVIEELSECLRKPQWPDHNHDQDLLKLQQVKEELAAYAKEVSMPFGELRLSPYQAMGIIAAMPEIPDLEYIFKEVEKWDEAKFLVGYELLEKLSININHIRNPRMHPWYGSRLRSSFTYQDKIKIKDSMNILCEINRKLQSSGEQLAEASCFKKPETYKDIEKMLEGTGVLVSLPGSAIALLKDIPWEELSGEINKILSCVNKFNQFKTWAKDKFAVSILEENVESLLQACKEYIVKTFYFLNFGFWKNIKIIKRHKDKKYKPKLKQIILDLEKICEAKKWVENIDEHNELGSNLCGDLWKGRDSDGVEIEKFLSWIISFHNYIHEGKTQLEHPYHST
ncbi:MAG: DUF4011 domain-containing protein, partial [Candidatus Omnitrophica bacterium]|nr:DUF4011 domain-containing protein [Candidatus Omnitrophota bacterium]